MLFENEKPRRKPRLFISNDISTPTQAIMLNDKTVVKLTLTLQGRYNVTKFLTLNELIR